MLAKEDLPFHHKPVPYMKVLRRYFPVVLIGLLLTLSLLCYVFVPQLRLPSGRPSAAIHRNLLSDQPLVSSSHVNLNSNANTRTTRTTDAVVVQRYLSHNDTHMEDENDLLLRSQSIELPSGEDPNSTVRAQRDFVKEMMRHSWDSYVKYTWGHNELKPLTLTGHTSDIFGGDNRLGATIVDSLSTLYIMNMSTEFKRGRDWVARHLNLDTVNNEMSVFETNIRFVGGLLAAYALSKDQIFLTKAKHVADRLLPAFETPTGLPLALINPSTGQSRNYGWASGGASILSEVGSHHLEFVYLSAVTGDQKYARKVAKIRNFLDEMNKPYEGLYHNYINPFTGSWGEESISIGALGDSYYEYLIKSWVQTNGTDRQSRRMFDTAMDAIEKRLVQKSQQSGLTYVAKQYYGRLEHKMEHLACFAGGMYVMGAIGTTNATRRDYYMQMGANITDTCAQSYKRTATHIGPEAFYFSDLYEAVALNNGERYYILRPEVIESYFYLWRATHDQRFRDYAWSATQAIARHCRTAHGFSGIRNVSDIHSAKDDVQQTFFLAETLKYLYLIFSSDDLMPMSEWVFNTEAHPFPILSAQELQRAGVAVRSTANVLRND